MSMINETDREKLMDAVAAITNPTEGQLVITEPVICKTCAYYIGSWCAEWIHDTWIPQPYDRYTEYMATREEAEEALECWV